MQSNDDLMSASRQQKSVTLLEGKHTAVSEQYLYIDILQTRDETPMAGTQGKVDFFLPLLKHQDPTVRLLMATT